MSESIDIVVVSNNINVQLWEMTRNTIRTAVDYAGMDIGTTYDPDTKTESLNVFTIEQCLYAMEQPIGRTMYYDFEFNYNRCLNFGRMLCKSQYIAFCNNDLLFDRNWARNIVQAMKAGSYLSACPTGRHVFKGVIEGYRVGAKGQLLGWCIVTDRRVFDKIGKFSEVVNFWYSDDIYGVQLQCAGVKHILVGNSHVKHFKSRTLTKLKGDRKDKTTGQEEIFLNYKKQMYADSGIEIEVKSGSRNRRKQRV